MKAVIFPKPREVEVGDRPDPEPRAGEITIRVRACGICGTDKHLFEGGFRGTYPLVPGHEYAGEVMAVGPEVDGVAVGDRVGVDPNIACGSCPYCHRGLLHLCERLQALGVTLDGGFAQLCRLPARQAHPLPDSVTFEEGALAEPLACCLHGIDLAGIAPGDTVLVLGGGPIGLMLLQLARVAGATRVLLSEPSKQRRELARQLGCDAAFDPTDCQLAEEVLALTGIGADVVIEAAGRPQLVTEAQELARRGGTVLLFGVCPHDATTPLSPYQIYSRELTIRGSFVNPFTHSRAIALIASGAVRVSPLVSHRYRLDDFPQALHKAGSGGVNKIVTLP